MYLHEFMVNQALFYSGSVDRLSSMLKGFPPGELRCYPKRDSYSCWISNKGNGRSYISSEDEMLIYQMAEKKVLTAELKDCCAELGACESYLKALERSPANALSEVLEDRYICRILGQKSKDERIQQWLDEDYKRNPFCPEHLIVPTITGERVRSKSEAMCAQLLYTMGIPYHYEQLLSIGGYEYYPDFTVMRPSDYELSFIEIFGMMDDPVYAAKAFSKLQMYAANGYVPQKNVICFFETKDSPVDMQFMQLSLGHFLGINQGGRGMGVPQAAYR